MKLLLSGDEYCSCFEGKYYLSETGKTFINRYLKAFEHVLVAFRTKHVNSENELGKYKYRMDNERVSFIDIPFFKVPSNLFLII